MADQTVEKEVEVDEVVIELSEADLAYQRNIDVLERIGVLFEKSIEFTHAYAPGSAADAALNDPLDASNFGDETVELREQALRKHYCFQMFALDLAMGF